MSVTPQSGCLTAKQIKILNDRFPQLNFELGNLLDDIFLKIILAGEDFEICDASDIPADTGGEQHFLCITDGVCTFLPKSEIIKLYETLTTLSYDSTTNTLVFTGEDGTPVSLVLNSSTFNYDPATNTVTHTGADGTVSTFVLNSSSIAYDSETNTITHTGADGTVTTLVLNNPTLSFDPASCELVFNDMLGDDTTIDLSSLNSSAPVFDDNDCTLLFTDAKGVETLVDLAAITASDVSFEVNTCVLTYTNAKGDETDIDLSLLDSAAPVYDKDTGVLTFTNAKGVESAVDLSSLINEEPVSCFYVDGDKSQINAAQKVCDAIDNGQALAFTDGNGTVQVIHNPVTIGDIVGQVSNAGGVFDQDTFTWTGAGKIAVCCEEEVCGHLNPAWVVHNAFNATNSPTETVHYRTGRAHEVPVSMTDFAGNPVGYTFSTAWCSQDRIVTGGPVREITQAGEAATISSDDECCGITCEPVCEEWRILVTDLDRNAILTVLNPGDINSVTPGNVGGLWTQDPVDPNIWTYDTLGNANPNGNFSIFADCDKQIQFSLDLLGGDCVGIQTRVLEGRAALVKYVCDPSVNSNRISATLPGDIAVNVNSVIIP